ncbi:MAG: tetratricopeptide repeat protein [Clostridiales bacterium]|jgi:tetratricopeptide (TPR) repeat protein|nr:tetratricopeptide repeat protein [Clostridiales bacterium]
MKNIPHGLHLSLLFIALWSIFSCCDDKSSRQWLSRAEQLINVDVDSALWLLGDSVRTDGLSRRQYAEWCLLLTQARDKKGEKHTSDSLIRVAAGYFENHGPAPRRMLAWYCMGRVSQELQRTPEAQDYYLKALEVDTSSTDHALLARIHSNLGMLYTYQDAPEMALPHLQKAEDYLRQIGDTLSLSLSLRDMARTYTLLKQPDSAICYYKQALKILPLYDKPFVLSELGDQYIKKGEHASAYSYLSDAIRMTANDSSDYTPIYFAMGKLFYVMDEPDSARYYLTKSMDSPQPETQASSYYYLYRMARENRQWEEYARLHEIYVSLSESIMEQMYTETMLKMQYAYDYQHVEKEAIMYKIRNLKNQKTIFLLVLGISIFIAASTGYILYYRKRNKQQQTAVFAVFKQLREKTFRISQEQIIANEKRIQELEAAPNKAGADFSWELDMLRSINHFITNSLQMKTANDDLLKNEAIYIKLHGFPTPTMSEQDYQELKETIDKFYPDFTSCFTASKGFSDENIQMAYLLKAGLKPGKIAQLLSRNRNTASMRLKSLAKKVFGGKNMGAHWNEDIIKYILDI